MSVCPRVVTASLLIAGASCTVNYSLQEDPPNPQLSLVKAAPLDILFVVDNSGSMFDEQRTLARSIYDPRCPVVDTANVPQDLQDPSRETFDALSNVCGLAQLMAMMNGDFHIGVITTDVGRCDERVGIAQDPDDLHEPTPMRGCLQGPGVITRDSDVETDFQDAMLGVGTYGSPFERGLDAMEVFLTPGSTRGPGCDNDLEGFLRPDGRLLIVFVTDEDDCSHRDGENGFHNELEFEPETCGEFTDLVLNYLPSACVDDADRLASVDSYRRMLRGMVSAGRTTDVLVSVVGGLVDGGDGLDGDLVPGACIATDDGVSGTCTAAFGTGATCAPEDNCCSADAANRYVALARAVNADSLVGSICADTFSEPLLPLFFQAELGGDDVF